MKGFAYWLVSLLAVLALFLSACASPQPPAPVAQRPAPATATPAPAAASLEEAARKEGQVVLWAHTIQAEEYLKFFKETYPSIELKIWDARSPDIVNRLSEEAKAGRFTVDVVTLEDSSMVFLEEMLLAYEWPTTRGWDEVYRPKHNRWRFFANVPKLPVYNSDLVSRADAPRSLDDLKDRKWRGKAVNSSSNTLLPTVYAYQWRQGEALNWDKSFAFWQEVVDNTRPMFSRGHDIQLASVAAGENLIHQMSAITTFLRYKWKGAPLAMAPLPEVPSNMWAVGILKTAPHPNAARLLADFYTSPQGQLFFSNNQGSLTHSPEAAKKAKPNLAVAEMGLKVIMAPPEVYTVDNVTKAGVFWSRVSGLR